MKRLLCLFQVFVYITSRLLAHVSAFPLVSSETLTRMSLSQPSGKHGDLSTPLPLFALPAQLSPRWGSLEIPLSSQFSTVKFKAPRVGFLVCKTDIKSQPLFLGSTDWRGGGGFTYSAIPCSMFRSIPPSSRPPSSANAGLAMADMER